MVDRPWLEMCANAGEFLYGLYTVKVLRQMYERKRGCHASQEELISAMQAMEEERSILVEFIPGSLDETDPDAPGFFAAADVRGTELESVLRRADADGNPYASLHFDSDEEMEVVCDVPEDLEFYVPTEAEIMQILEEGYIRTPEMTELENRMRKHGGDTDALKHLWGQISTGKMDMMEAIQAILDAAFRKGKAEEDQAERKPENVDAALKELMPAINGWVNSINQRNRKGWRPQDLFKKMHPHGLTSMPTIVPGSAFAAKQLREAEPQLREMGARVDYSSMDSWESIGEYGEKRIVKVGRNDLCPCGSGKKYKRCHGR